MSESEPGKKLEPKYGSPFTYFFVFCGGGGVHILYSVYCSVYVCNCRCLSEKKRVKPKILSAKKNKTIKNNTW